MEFKSYHKNAIHNLNIKDLLNKLINSKKEVILFINQ